MLARKTFPNARAPTGHGTQTCDNENPSRKKGAEWEESEACVLNIGLRACNEDRRVPNGFLLPIRYRHVSRVEARASRPGESTRPMKNIDAIDNGRFIPSELL